MFQAERYLIQEVRFQRCWKDWVGESGAGNVVLSEDLAVPEATPPCGSLHKTAATTFTGALRGSILGQNCVRKEWSLGLEIGAP